HPHPTQEYPGQSPAAEHALTLYTPAQSHAEPPGTDASTQSIAGTQTLPQTDEAAQTESQPLHPAEPADKQQPKRLHVSNIPFRSGHPGLLGTLGCWAEPHPGTPLRTLGSGTRSSSPGAAPRAPAPRQPRCPQALSPRPLSPQVNNATARVMTNKKAANPYSNGSGGDALLWPRGSHTRPLPPAVTGFPYPTTGTAVGYRGAHLGGRGRAVYSAFRAAPPPPPIPTYGAVVYQDGFYGAEIYVSAAGGLWAVP
ncbi:RFOX3 protein, partial [Upupa epops]|nr:RFOX3 protein [Upupa epops]